MTAQLIVDLRPAEIDGKFWIMVIMDGREINWRGPFPDADAAEAAPSFSSNQARAAAGSIKAKARFSRSKGSSRLEKGAVEVRQVGLPGPRR